MKTPVASQIPTKLIDGRLVFAPHPDEHLYRFTVTARLGNLLQGLVIVGGPNPSPLVSDPVGNAMPTVTIRGIVRVA